MRNQLFFFLYSRAFHFVPFLVLASQAFYLSSCKRCLDTLKNTVLVYFGQIINRLSSELSILFYFLAKHGLFQIQRNLL